MEGRDPDSRAIVDAAFVKDDDEDQEAEDSADGCAGYEAGVAAVVMGGDDLGG